jgi:hypothetical protein
VKGKSAMKPLLPTIAAAACAALLSVSHAADVRGAKPQYLDRAEQRFGDFAGSRDNLNSLVTGLRTGGQITLSSRTETVGFSPPTRPMGYGNITRALDLAQRQLAAQGIGNPTPTQLQAALSGGTVTGANGTITMPGVLQLRSSGMGWGQIAHTVGVSPGLGVPSQTHVAPAPIATGITTAAGAPAAASAAGISHAHAGGGNNSSGVTGATGKGQGNAVGRTGR